MTRTSRATADPAGASTRPRGVRGRWTSTTSAAEGREADAGAVAARDSDTPPAEPTGPRHVPYSLAGRCTRCGKRLIVNGVCFTCATGRPRTLLRPEEMPESLPRAA